MCHFFDDFGNYNYLSELIKVMDMLIGRKEELQEIRNAYNSEYSQFVAVYGRRRVGKTFLIREAFNYSFTFQHTGLANVKMREQLEAFRLSLIDQGDKDCPVLHSWLEAFNELKKIIKSSRKKKKVIFIDEISWMDTPKSSFLAAFENFWNGWCTARKDILLVICASATSWIINKVLKNRGGLHNRVNLQIPLAPFTLKECEEYLISQYFKISRYQILMLYMVMGGPAYYWSLLNKSKSAAQNIDSLFFKENGLLKNEYDALYASLFKNPELYIKIVSILGNKASGLTRTELVEKYGLDASGTLTKSLEELEQCGFVKKYKAYGKEAKDAVYQLIDNYTLFYFKFIREADGDTSFWTHTLNTPIQTTWCGYAFERVCLQHINQIKKALGISAVSTKQSAWRSDAALLKKGERGAQIDLLIERKDDTINICEMKWSSEPFVITSDYDSELRNKVTAFIRETKTRKTIHTTMVTTYGVKKNMYSDDYQSEVMLDNLFM